MKTMMQPRLFSGDSAEQLYLDVLQALLEEGELVGSVQDRSSVGSGWGLRERPTKELRHVTLILSNPRNRLLSRMDMERIAPRAVCSILLDEMDLEALCFYDSKARAFSDDGKTVTTNYGYRIRHFDGVDQIAKVIEQFKSDPNTRRAVIHIHRMEDAEKKYDPCIDSLHFLLRNGALECQSFWRSENAFSLLPVNLFEFTLLHEFIAAQLQVEVGIYAHTVTSLHYYIEDEDKIKAAMALLGSSPHPMKPMPNGSDGQIRYLQFYEKMWRQSPEKAGCYLDAMPIDPYWQFFADAIVSAIKRQRC